MFTLTLAFLLGDVFLQSFSTLPPMWLILLFAASISLMFILGWLQNKKCRLLIAFVLGFIYAAWYAHNIMQWTLPKEIENRPTPIHGFVSSLPIESNHKTQFELSTPQGLIRLTWNDPTRKILVGDEWRFFAKLKRIHATQSPGSMDFEAWALQKKIRAKGSIDNHHIHEFISHGWYRYPITLLRQQLLLKINEALPNSYTSPWLAGLIVGERNNINPKAWQVLRNTGTNHLMVIAGLHIGIIVTIAHFLFKYGVRFYPRIMLILPKQILSAIAALMVAIYYSAQAGFSIPTQRASFMLSILVIVLYRKKLTTAWHVWSLALLLVLLLNPLSVLTDSFWLSFVTIALIIYGMRARVRPSGWWWHWGRVQWVIAVGLIPLSLMFFQECSIVSVLANSIAIPWLGFFVLPFCLLAGFFLPLSTLIGGIFLKLADISLGCLWSILEWFSHLDWAIWQHAIPNVWIMILSMMAVLILLLPNGVAGRGFGIIFLLPLLFPATPQPKPGQYWLTLLDVGQGLSVVVQTAQHVLLFDTGPNLPGGMDAGEQIVVPYLRSKNISKLDTVILSHGDNDHRGGFEAVRHALPIDSILTSVPQLFPFSITKPCYAGDHWQWDGVQFTILHPSRDNMGYGNDSSCVVMVDNGYRKVLLTADIESWAEQKILARSGDVLHADILIAPHHGSKTSSSEAFISAILPQFVAYSTGYLNRYHFPHDRAIKTYKALRVQQLDTATSGTIEFKLDKLEMLSPIQYRMTNKHYWFD